MKDNLPIERGCLVQLRTDGRHAEVFQFSEELGEWETTYGWYKQSELTVVAGPEDFEE